MVTHRHACLKGHQGGGSPTDCTAILQQTVCSSDVDQVIYITEYTSVQYFTPFENILLCLMFSSHCCWHTQIINQDTRTVLGLTERSVVGQTASGCLGLGRSQLVQGRYKDNILVLRSWSPLPVQAWERGGTASANPGQEVEHLNIFPQLEF